MKLIDTLSERWIRSYVDRSLPKIGLNYRDEFKQVKVEIPDSAVAQKFFMFDYYAVDYAYDSRNSLWCQFKYGDYYPQLSLGVRPISGALWLCIVRQYDTATAGTHVPKVSIITPVQPIVSNQKQNIIFEVNWQSNYTGYVKLYIDGVLKATVNGPNMDKSYNMSQRSYPPFRLGNYQFTWGDIATAPAITKRTVLFRHVVIGGQNMNINQLLPTPSVPSALQLNTSSITTASYRQGGVQASGTVFNIKGSNLTSFPGNVTITGSTHYEVSATSATTGFSTSVTVPYTSATLAQKNLWVRLKSGLSSSVYNAETISFANVDTTIYLTVNGQVLAASGTNYYISNAGSDVAAGTSTGTAWQTISKLNAMSGAFSSGDSIFFHRGETYFGAVNVGSSNLYFGAYGLGTRPVISGFVTAGSWVADVMTGVWKTPVNAKNNLIMVTKDGKPQQIGRYPNADATNHGYLTFEGFNTGYIIDSQLTSATNWTGAELLLRGNDWNIDRTIITSHSGNRLNYRVGRGVSSWITPLLSIVKANYGYFIQNDKRTLDKAGEWWYDSTGKYIYMYSGVSAPSGVKVSVIDTLMNCRNKNNITISDIDFDGANMSAIYLKDASTLTVKNSNITNCGAKGVHVYNTSDVLVQAVSCNNILSNSIYVNSKTKNNVAIRACAIKNNAPLVGMGSYFEYNDNKAIVGVTNNLTIEDNSVDSTGLNGIDWNGSNVLIQHNTVKNFCLELHDNGGIYTYFDINGGSTNIALTNRVIKENTVLYGYGNFNGTPRGTNSDAADGGAGVAGIYLDGITANVSVVDNNIGFVGKNGIHTNNPMNITITGNVIWAARNYISFMVWPYGVVGNLRITGNVLFPRNDSENLYYYTNAKYSPPLGLNLQNLAFIDSNYYSLYNEAGFVTEFSNAGNIIKSSPLSYDSWRATTGFDANSYTSVRKPSYKVTSMVSANKASNAGTFNSNITGYTVYGTSTTGLWDNTNKINGGSLKFNFTAPQAGRFSFVHSPVGAISSAKKYLLRYTTLGTGSGITNAYIRRTASPYESLTPVQRGVFGAVVKTHEFLFTAPTTVTAGSIVIAIDQSSGATYLDNIQFYEVNATLLDVLSEIRYEYNDTGAEKVITTSRKYITAAGESINGKITMPPYSSMMFIDNGAATSTATSGRIFNKYQ
jgi:hypothetical protein